MIPMTVIKKFCNDPESSVKDLWKNHDGNIFSCNGRVLLRVDCGSDEEVSDTDMPQERKDKSEDLIRRNDSNYAISTHEVKDIELNSVVCNECGGTGHVEETECDECYGTGEVECMECGHESECKACGGTGEKHEDGPCEKCGGTGKTYPRMKLGCAIFDGKFIALLALLPNCRIEVTDRHIPARFIFDGGRGLIMPMTA